MVSRVRGSDERTDPPRDRSHPTHGVRAHGQGRTAPVRSSVGTPLADGDGRRRAVTSVRVPCMVLAWCRVRVRSPRVERRDGFNNKFKTGRQANRPEPSRESCRHRSEL